MEHYALRRQALVGLLREAEIEALLVSSPVNVRYLTGFTGDSSHLLVAGRESTLVSDGRYTQQIEDECPGLPVHIRPTGQNILEVTARVVTAQGFRAVGFEAAHLSVADRDRLADASPAVSWAKRIGLVEGLRATKDEREIRAICRAIAVAERAFEMFRVMLGPDDTEEVLAHRIEAYVRQAGGRGCSFPPIIAGGPRSALAHAPPTARTAGEAAELLLVDWGADGPGGYKSDLTRVLPVRKISSKLQEVYAVVLRAQKNAVDAIRPGIPAREVDAVARKVIADAGFGDRFIHGLGHGIGLQIHEAPALRPDSVDVLSPGMVVTVEPGIYLPGWGGVRLEDDVLVTPDGREVLTRVPGDLAALRWEPGNPADTQRG